MALVRIGSRTYWRMPQVRGLHDFNICIRPEARIKVRFGIKGEFVTVRKYHCLGPNHIDHYGMIIEDIVFNIKTGQINIESNEPMKKRQTQRSYRIQDKDYEIKLNDLLLVLSNILAGAVKNGIRRNDRDLQLIRGIVKDIGQSLYKFD